MKLSRVVAVVVAILLTVNAWADMPNPIRMIGDLVTPDSSEDDTRILAEVSAWKAMGYNTVLFAYYDEPITDAERILAAVQDLDMSIVFAYAERFSPNDNLDVHSPRWIKASRLIKARPTDQQIINTLLPYADAVMFFWRGNALVENAVYDSLYAGTPIPDRNPNFTRVNAAAKAKTRGISTRMQIRNRYPDCEVWGNLEVHGQRNGNHIESWTEDVDRVFLTGLTHTGMKGMVVSGAGLTDFVERTLGQRYPVVVGPVMPAVYWRTYVRMPWSEKPPQEYSQFNSAAPGFGFDQSFSYKKNGEPVEFGVFKKGSPSWDFVNATGVAHHESNRSTRKEYAKRYSPAMPKAMQDGPMPYTLTFTNTAGDVFEAIPAYNNTDENLQQLFAPPIQESLWAIHADTEKYMTWLLDTGASGALRVVGDGADERRGNSDQIGYHDYGWTALGVVVPMRVGGSTQAPKKWWTFW